MLEGIDRDRISQRKHNFDSTLLTDRCHNSSITSESLLLINGDVLTDRAPFQSPIRVLCEHHLVSKYKLSIAADSSVERLLHGREPFFNTLAQGSILWFCQPYCLVLYSSRFVDLSQCCWREVLTRVSLVEECYSFA